MRTALLLLLLVGACKKPNPNCERSVKHVFDLTMSMGGVLSEPKGLEKSAVEQARKAAMDRCKDEGLSDAQRDCIVAAKSLFDRDFLMCPALVAKPPTWIIAPIGHPELLDEKNRPKEEPLDLSAVDPGGSAADKPADPAADKPAGSASDKPAGSASDKPAGSAADKK
jgi:hypothetical protein